MQHEVGAEELPFDVLEVEPGFKEPLFLKVEDAREDVERLFYLLENGYAGYGYFEDLGDFEVSKEGIMAELDGKYILQRGDLSKIIHEHLGFLHDSHLSIGDNGYGKHHDFWYSSHEVRQDAQGYKLEQDGVNSPLVSVNGESPDLYLFPSINSLGDSVFRLGVLSPEQTGALEVELENVDEPLQVELERSERVSGPLFSDELVGGVPVVKIWSFSDQHKEYIDQFLASASKYKDEPCLIVDIRGNGGGNTAYAREWVTGYTGHNPGSIQIYTELVSETSMMGRANYFSYNLHHYPELEEQGYSQKAEGFRDHAKEVEEGEYPAYWSPYNVPVAKDIPSNRTLIVLVDSGVGSAAEGFLCYLRQVENVVLLGENSGGAVIYGQMTMHMLPNSHLQVRLPITLNVFTDLVYREERGFYPDIWVPAGDAVNHAVAGVRSGAIPTSDEYIDHLSYVAFVPQTPPVEGFGMVDLLPYALFLFYGGPVVYVNRKRGWKAFLVGSVFWVLVWFLLASRNPMLRNVFLSSGVEYLLIALYKRWKDLQN